MAVIVGTKAVRGQAFGYVTQHTYMHVEQGTVSSDEWNIGFVKSVSRQGLVTAWLSGRDGQKHKGRPGFVHLIDPDRFPPEIIRVGLADKDTFSTKEELKTWLLGLLIEKNNSPPLRDADTLA